jgi:molybdate transport system substrate-binding protein
MWSSSCRRRARRRLAASVAALTVAAGCGGGASGSVLEVFAAASLTEALTALAPGFEAAHPGTDVRFNFAGSSALARQVVEGATPDVVATADQATMAGLVEEGHVEAPQVVARNRLAIVVARGNPERLRGLVDLARPGLTVVVCAAEVPCGRLAAAALLRAGVVVEPASLEENVKAVVARVTLGEADAGLAYASDVVAAGDRVAAVPLGPGLADDPALQAVYPMAVAVGARRRGLARAFVDHVASPTGRRVLGAAGFVGL